MEKKNRVAYTENIADGANREIRARLMIGCGQVMQLHGCGRAQRNLQALAAWQLTAARSDVMHRPNRSQMQGTLEPEPQ
jgi:hypothetical protein